MKEILKGAFPHMKEFYLAMAAYAVTGIVLFPAVLGGIVVLTKLVKIAWTVILWVWTA